MATTTTIEPRTQLGLSPEQAGRHAEALRRRRSRAEGIRYAEKKIDKLAADIGRLVLHIEAYRGDVSAQERERWELVVQMDNLVRWLERQQINGKTDPRPVGTDFAKEASDRGPIGGGVENSQADPTRGGSSIG